MLNTLPINLFRLIILVVMQVLVFSNLQISPYFQLFIYPLFIFLLPFETPRWLQMILGFSIGIIIDFFVGSMGLNAATAVFVSYMREPIIRLVSLKGAEFEVTPNIFLQGFGWFFPYMGVLLILFCGFYFIVESGSFYNLFYLLIKILLSAFFSLLFMFILLYLFTQNKKRRLG